MIYQKLPSQNGDLEGISNFLYNQHSSNFDQYLTAVAPPVYRRNDITFQPIESTIIPNYSEGDSSYCSYDITAPFTIYHFTKHYLKLTNYTIQARYDDLDTMIGWALYGSLDNETWVQIDRQIDVEELKIANARKTFSVPDNEQYFQFYQILSLQNIRKDANFMCYSKIEFFGILSTKIPQIYQSSKYPKCYCITSQYLFCMFTSQ